MAGEQLARLGQMNLAEALAQPNALEFDFTAPRVTGLFRAADFEPTGVQILNPWG